MASELQVSGPAGRERDLAFADAIDEGALVLMRLSARLRALHATPGTKTVPPARSAVVDVGRAQPLGQRQLAVLSLGGLGEQQGLAAGEVARALGYSPSNATNLLKWLEERQYLVKVLGERPTRWRRATLADS